VATAFDPLDLAGRRLANRIVMAPMSRSRAYGPRACPSPSAATYYAQRACAGLIVSEGIQPSAMARGYDATPGLHTDEQVAAWRTVTEAVHASGGTIYAQLMHAGRVGHPSLLPEGRRPVAPSSIAAAATIFTQAGPRPCVVPQELTEPEIRAVIANFAAAARNAVAAGFDGVELHGANGFLVHQFLSANANARTDDWGGSISGRIRFAVETLEALASAVGPDRVGVQISPGNPYNDIAEDESHALYGALVGALEESGLAYLSVAEGPDRALTLRLREQWPGVYMLNPFTAPRPTGLGELRLVADGTADLLSFGSMFLANPDLPRRLAQEGPFNAPDPSTYYGGGDHGYTDYPFLEDADDFEAAEPAPSPS
jgi:N-ethylmaleimide reductase